MTSLPGLFITGTDTGVGKTYIAAAIVRRLVAAGRFVGVLKPVSSGGTEDAQDLIEAQGGKLSLSLVNPIQLAEPLAPNIAARRAGLKLSFSDVLREVQGSLASFAYLSDIMIVEGAGGLLCPLTDGTTIADLAIVLDFPLIIVARRGLGTINHTLLTVEAAKNRGLRVAGIIMNGADYPNNEIAESTAADEISRRLGAIPVLAEVPHGSNGAALLELDWAGRAARPRGDFSLLQKYQSVD